ncbi:MAG: HypC/HybG/HupF family hydrogenase formation chaperone, partial [Clostridiales bacterium]|nr:HypC/HybG/HupF family hydrogenase formation chaperone [Clostridiales bacterium]
VLPVELGAVDADVGDHVLVHAGCAIAKIAQSDADELNQLHQMLGEYADG